MVRSGSSDSRWKAARSDLFSRFRFSAGICKIVPARVVWRVLAGLCTSQGNGSRAARTGRQRRHSGIRPRRPFHSGERPLPPPWLRSFVDPVATLTLVVWSACEPWFRLRIYFLGVLGRHSAVWKLQCRALIGAGRRDIFRLDAQVPWSRPPTQ